MKQTAYNFFYRDERARIMSGDQEHKQQQQQPSTTSSSSSSRSKKRRHVEEGGASVGSTVVTATATATATVTDVSTSNADASSSGEGDTSTTASESDKSKSGGDAHPTNNSASISPPLPPHLQSLQQAGTSDEAIAALVEHQSSFRDTSREIAKRWKAIGVSDFDRYQQLAKRDAERYKRELAEYEAERKRREAIADKVNAASAASAAKAVAAATNRACAPSKTNTSTTNHAPSIANDIPASMLPWSNQYQPQRQQVEGLYQQLPVQNTTATEVALPFLQSTPTTANSTAPAQISASSSNNNANDGGMQIIITQLLQNQLQLLNAQPPQPPTLQAQELLGQLTSSIQPSRAPPPARTNMLQQQVSSSQMPSQDQMGVGVAGAGGPANNSDQSKIIHMLLQQNQRLQMEVQNLRHSEEMQKQLIEQQSKQLQEQQQRASNQSFAFANGGVVSSATSGSSTSASNGPTGAKVVENSSADPSPLPASNDIQARTQQSSAKRRPSSSDDVRSEKSHHSNDAAKMPSKKKAKRTTKAKKGGKSKSDDDSASVDEASKGLLSLRSRVSGSSDTGLSSLSTLTSIKGKSLEATGKKEEMSDISTSASDARKPNGESSSDTGSSTNNGSQSEASAKAKAKNDNAEDVVSDVSSSGESDDTPKKRHRKEDSSSDSPVTSSNGDSSSSGSSSPHSDEVGGETEDAKSNQNTQAPPAKKVRVVEPTSSRRVTRSSGSDSGELSSESSWCANEDTSNGPTTDATNGSSKIKAGILKTDRMYTSEMSSVSASGSDNASALGSDEEKAQSLRN